MSTVIDACSGVFGKPSQRAEGVMAQTHPFICQWFTMRKTCVFQTPARRRNTVDYCQRLRDQKSSPILTQSVRFSCVWN